MKVGDIEYVPAELQGALPWHLPTFAQRHIQVSVAIPANHVARSALTGKRVSEVGIRRGGIGETADRPGAGIFIMSDLRPCHHLSDALLVPVGGPEVAIVDGEGKTAGPSTNTCKLPAANERIDRRGGISGKTLAPAYGQVVNPIRVQLVSGIEIRHRSSSCGTERIHQTAARS